MSSPPRAPSRYCRRSSGTCSVLLPASVFESGIQSSFPSSSRSRTTRLTISPARIPITSVRARPPRPSSPSSASSTAFACHLRASSMRSWPLPWRRLPIPCTPSSGLRGSHFFPTDHFRNVFASARMFRCESTASGLPYFVLAESQRLVVPGALRGVRADRESSLGEEDPQAPERRRVGALLVLLSSRKYTSYSSFASAIVFPSALLISRFSDRTTWMASSSVSKSRAVLLPDPSTTMIRHLCL